jgi:hypothetical protein
LAYQSNKNPPIPKDRFLYFFLYYSSIIQSLSKARNPTPNFFHLFLIEKARGRSGSAFLIKNNLYLDNEIDADQRKVDNLCVRMTDDGLYKPFLILKQSVDRCFEVV